MKIITLVEVSYQMLQNNLKPHKTTILRSLEFLIMMGLENSQMVFKIYLRRKRKVIRKRRATRKRRVKKARNSLHNPQRKKKRMMIKKKRNQARKNYLKPKKEMMTKKKEMKRKMKRKKELKKAKRV